MKIKAGFVCLVVVSFLAIPIILKFNGGCVNENLTRRVLTEQGYTHIEMTGYRWFMSDEADFYSTGFKAKSSNGSNVSGAVSSGPFKGATIRLD